MSLLLIVAIVYFAYRYTSLGSKAGPYVKKAADRLLGLIPASLRTRIAKFFPPPKEAILPLQGAVVWAAVLYILPLDWIISSLLFECTWIATLFYTLCILATTLASAFTIYVNYGIPKPEPDMKTGVMMWFMKVQNSADIHWFLYGTIFLAFQPMSWVFLIIPVRRSVFASLNALTKTGMQIPGYEQHMEAIKTAYAQLKAEEPKILLYSSCLEVVIGFFMILDTLLVIMSESRQIMSTYMYCMFMYTRYAAPRSTKVTGEAWTLILKRIPGGEIAAQKVLAAIEPLKQRVNAMLGQK